MWRLTLSLLLISFYVAKSSKNNSLPLSSNEPACSNVGSLMGMLSFIRTVTNSLEELVQSAQHKAVIVEDGFCGNEKKNSTATKDSMCLKAETDCHALYTLGLRKSGVYRIWPKFLNHSIRVFCDMETDNGGWTLIQRRGDYGDPLRNFFETWENYKKGFGKIEEDFWLGNDYIFALTNQHRMVLRIDLEDFDKQKRFAKYRDFLVRSELEKYKMTFEGYDGNAGNSLHPHNGKVFVTKDNGGGCANSFKGGWWYASCHEANLNGIYYRGGYHENFADGVDWFQFRGYNYSMKNAEMKIRPSVD